MISSFSVKRTVSRSSVVSHFTEAPLSSERSVDSVLSPSQSSIKFVYNPAYDGASALEKVEHVL